MVVAEAAVATLAAQRHQEDMLARPLVPGMELLLEEEEVDTLEQLLGQATLPNNNKEATTIHHRRASTVTNHHSTSNIRAPSSRTIPTTTIMP